MTFWFAPRCYHVRVSSKPLANLMKSRHPLDLVDFPWSMYAWTVFTYVCIDLSMDLCIDLSMDLCIDPLYDTTQSMRLCMLNAFSDHCLLVFIFENILYGRSRDHGFRCFSKLNYIHYSVSMQHAWALYAHFVVCIIDYFSRIFLYIYYTLWPPWK